VPASISDNRAFGIIPDSPGVTEIATSPGLTNPGNQHVHTCHHLLVGAAQASILDIVTSLRNRRIKQQDRK
jgi:hypothetical protein